MEEKLPIYELSNCEKQMLNKGIITPNEISLEKILEHAKTIVNNEKHQKDN